MNLKATSRKKAVLTQLFGGYTFTIISMVQGFFLLPLYLTYISMELYGYWLTVNSILGLLTIVNFGVGMIGLQRMSKFFAKKNYYEVSSYFINLIYITIGIVFIFIMLSIIVFYNLSEIIKMDVKYIVVLERCFYLMSIVFALQMINNVFFSFSSATLNLLYQTKVRIIGQLLVIFITVFLIINNYGLISIPIAALTGEIIIFFFSLHHLSMVIGRRYFTYKISISKIKDMLKFSPAMIASYTGNKILDSSHPVIITNYLGAEVTTIYTLIVKLAEIILKACRIFSSSLIASLTNMYEKDSKRRINDTLHNIFILYFLMLVIVLSLYYSVNIDFIKLWIDKNINIDKIAIIYIVLAIFLHSFLELIKNIYYSSSQFNKVSYLIFFSSIIYILSMVFLISYYNIIAIPLSYSIAIGISLLIILLNIKYKYTNKLIFKCTLYLFVTILSTLISENIIQVFNWYQLSYKVILILIQNFIIIWLFFRIEMKQIYLLYSKKNNIVEED